MHSGGSKLKLLSVAIPCFNSEAYLSRAIESLLSGGEEVEIMIINDGSTDNTASIADDYQRRYPHIVRSIHQPNGGHGDAVMTGLKHASGLYFKVVDSDDWVNEYAYSKILETLRGLTASGEQVDLLVSNYVYDKLGMKHKKVVSFKNALPENRTFTWDETKRFRVGQYILMHAVIYRTEILRTSGLQLPKHTFYVDSLYVYVPMPHVSKIYYLNVDFYHYFIGREDQSVQLQVMIKRIDQQIRVNRLMSEAVDLSHIGDRRLRCYMRNHLEIITTVTTVIAILSKDPQVIKKSEALWRTIEEETPNNYHFINYRPLSIACRLPGSLGRAVVTLGHHISRRLYGFS